MNPSAAQFDVRPERRAGTRAARPRLRGARRRAPAVGRRGALPDAQPRQPQVVPVGQAAGLPADPAHRVHAGRARDPRQGHRRRRAVHLPEPLRRPLRAARRVRHGRRLARGALVPRGGGAVPARGARRARGVGRAAAVRARDAPARDAGGGHRDGRRARLVRVHDRGAAAAAPFLRGRARRRRRIGRQVDANVLGGAGVPPAAAAAGAVGGDARAAALRGGGRARGARVEGAARPLSRRRRVRRRRAAAVAGAAHRARRARRRAAERRGGGPARDALLRGPSLRALGAPRREQ